MLNRSLHYWTIQKYSFSVIPAKRQDRNWQKRKSCCFVIPAQAGIQSRCKLLRFWMPDQVRNDGQNLVAKVESATVPTDCRQPRWAALLRAAQVFFKIPRGVGFGGGF